MRLSHPLETIVRRVAGALAGCILAMAGAGEVRAQSADCARLQQQIAAGGSNRYASEARRANAELARTAAYARQLNCGRQQFLFFGGSSAPQCEGLNARIAQLQAAVAQYQAAGGRNDLVARYNASCRGGQQSAAVQPRPRGFFESLFGGGEEARPAPPPEAVAPPTDDADGGEGAHGGSQAVCVRTCDGGFFPMGVSARRGEDGLNEMCAALCPGTQVAVYTRNPNSEIRTAVSLDGQPYMDLPNALKFQKSYDSACTCRPAGKTWADALTGAEMLLGNGRRGDILVTPEKSVELSRPKLDAHDRAALLSTRAATATPPVPPAPAADRDDANPDGSKPRIRTVGPKL